MDAELRERFPTEYKRDHEKQAAADAPGEGDADESDPDGELMHSTASTLVDELDAEAQR